MSSLNKPQAMQTADDDIRIKVRTRHDEITGQSVINATIEDKDKHYHVDFMLVRPRGTLAFGEDIESDIARGLFQPRNDTTIKPSSLKPSQETVERLQSSQVSPSNSREKVDIPLGLTDKKSTSGSQSERFLKRYSQFMTNHTFKICGVTAAVYCVMIVMWVFLFVLGYPVMQWEFRGIPTSIHGSDIYHKSKVLSAVLTDNRILRFSPFDSNAEQTTTNLERFIETYRGDDKKNVAGVVLTVTDHHGNNIMTKHHLKMLERFEQSITRDIDYKCDPTNCAFPAYSLIRLFDGGFNRTDPGFRDPHFNEIPRIIRLALKYNKTRFFTGPLLEKSSKITSKYVISNKTFVSFLGDERGKTINNWAKTFANLNKNGHEKLHIQIKSWKYYFDMVANKAMRERALVAVSVVLYILFLFCFTFSIWLTVCGLINMCVCFIITNLIYSVVFQYRYFGYYHIITIFVIAKLTARDLILAREACEMLDVYDSLRYCIKPMVVSSIFVALFTVPAAFSPILAISSFAVFTTTFVTVHVISVLPLLPSLSGISKFYPCDMCAVYCSSKFKLCKSKPGNECKPIVHRFMDKYLFEFYSRRVVQLILILTFLIITTVMIYFFSKTKYVSGHVKYLHPNENVESIHDERRTEFMSREPNICTDMYIIWGLHDKTRDTCSSKEYNLDTCKYATLYKKGFNINNDEQQKDIMNLCRQLLELEESAMNKLRIRVHPTLGHREIYCFLDQLRNDLKNEIKQTASKFPWTREKVTRIHRKIQNEIKQHTNNRVAATYNQRNPNFIEEFLYIWKNDAWFDKRHYENIAALFNHKQDKSFAYVAVKIVLGVHSSEDYNDGMKVYNDWEKLVSSAISKMSPGLRHGFQATESTWHDFHVRTIAYTHNIIHLCSSLCVMLLIIILFRHHLVLATLTILSILSVFVIVVGITTAIHETYGIFDVINSSAILALTAEYIIFWTLSYINCDKFDSSKTHRDDVHRVRYTLTHTSFPLVFAALTVMIPAFILLFSKVQIVYRFALVMLMSSFASVYCAVVLIPITILLIKQSVLDSEKNGNSVAINNENDGTGDAKIDESVVARLSAKESSTTEQKVVKQEKASIPNKKLIFPTRMIKSFFRSNVKPLQPTNEDTRKIISADLNVSDFEKNKTRQRGSLKERKHHRSIDTCKNRLSDSVTIGDNIQLETDEVNVNDLETNKIQKRLSLTERKHPRSIDIGKKRSSDSGVIGDNIQLEEDEVNVNDLETNKIQKRLSLTEGKHPRSIDIGKKRSSDSGVIGDRVQLDTSTGFSDGLGGLLEEPLPYKDDRSSSIDIAKLASLNQFDSIDNTLSRGNSNKDKVNILSRDGEKGDSYESNYYTVPTNPKTSLLSYKNNQPTTDNVIASDNTVNPKMSIESEKEFQPGTMSSIASYNNALSKTMPSVDSYANSQQEDTNMTMPHVTVTADNSIASSKRIQAGGTNSTTSYKRFKSPADHSIVSFKKYMPNTDNSISSYNNTTDVSQPYRASGDDVFPPSEHTQRSEKVAVDSDNNPKQEENTDTTISRGKLSADVSIGSVGNMAAATDNSNQSFKRFKSENSILSFRKFWPTMNQSGADLIQRSDDNCISSLTENVQTAGDSNASKQDIQRPSRLSICSYKNIPTSTGNYISSPTYNQRSENSIILDKVTSQTTKKSQESYRNYPTTSDSADKFAKSNTVTNSITSYKNVGKPADNSISAVKYIQETEINSIEQKLDLSNRNNRRQSNNSISPQYTEDNNENIDYTYTLNETFDTSADKSIGNKRTDSSHYKKSSGGDALRWSTKTTAGSTRVSALDESHITQSDYDIATQEGKTRAYEESNDVYERPMSVDTFQKNTWKNKWVKLPKFKNVLNRSSKDIATAAKHSDRTIASTLTDIPLDTHPEVSKKK